MSDETLLSIIGITVAVVGAVIALATAAFTFWQAHITRRHNRLSVKPILRFDRDTVLGQPFGITLRNCGVGPALLKSFQLFIDGRPVDTSNLVATSPQLREIGFIPERTKIYHLYPNESFATNETHVIIETMTPVATTLDALKLKAAIDRISIEINYTSVYDEPFTVLLPSRRGA